MANETTPTPPATEQGSEGGTQEKLIAGKYKTIEEAVEKGYTGLEAKMHELAQQNASVIRLLESALAPASPNGVPVGRGAPNSRDPYGRNYPQPDEDEINPADFITDPAGHLRRRDKRLLEQVGQVVSSIVMNREIVNDFKERNPHLKKHEKLVKAFMADQPQHLSLEEKLEAAGKAASAYLATYKAELGGRDPAAPANTDYVEGPSGGPMRTPNPYTPAVAADPDEKELVEYINERTKDYADHFGLPARHSK